VKKLRVRADSSGASAGRKLFFALCLPLTSNKEYFPFGNPLKKENGAKEGRKETNPFPVRDNERETVGAFTG